MGKTVEVGRQGRHHALQRRYGSAVPRHQHPYSLARKAVEGIPDRRLAHLQASPAARCTRPGTTVVFTQQLTIKENKEGDEERRISMLRTYTVFNEAQIDGLPKTPQAELLEYTDEDALAFSALMTVELHATAS
jgi:hypothetical protein